MHCYVNTMPPSNPETTNISKKSSPHPCPPNHLLSRTWMTRPNAVKLENAPPTYGKDYINSLGRTKKCFGSLISSLFLSVSGFGKEMW
jgi:hypothetical protein